MNHSEINKVLNIPRSSLSDILAGLIKNNTLILDSTNKKYKLGPQLLVLASRYLTSLDIAQQGQPILREMMKETNESAVIMIRKENEVLVVSKVDSPQPITRQLTIGSVSPLYCTAAGKNFLAYQSTDETRHYFASVGLTPLTKNTITDPDRLLKELEAIRSGEPAYNREENIEGIIAIGKPVFDYSKKIIGSIVIPVPKIRFNPGIETVIRRVIHKAANALSYKMGYFQNS